MRFARTLRNTVYPPWRDNYIDYDKLKKLLRDSGSAKGSPSNRSDEDDEWTDEDEGAFVEELVNVQLEKVHTFHSEKYRELKDRTATCEAKLDPIVAASKSGDGEDAAEDGAAEEGPEREPGLSDEGKKHILEQVLRELDSITKETSELERYARINYTGFLKAAKKHDRRRGHDYRVRPLLQVRLAALPFNQEDYSPLLYRLSAMYSFVRQQLEGKGQRGLSSTNSQTGGDLFTSHKFWVHLENLLEVKTVILRRLPVLVYNPQTSKIAEGSQRDPTITSIYFDDPKFGLYNDKVNHEPDASSLRLRWYGQLADKPEIFFEKKTITSGDASLESRFPIKEKYIQPYIRGEYKMEKSIQKIQDREGDDSDRADQLQKSVDDIQKFIQDNQLQPVLRANYTRTAFQIPGDDRVRISLDTNLALIREDAIDRDRPCRDPDDWHRKDIDDARMEFPFSSIRKGEINRFPFALLEIRVRGRKRYEWVTDLMNSHLVKEAPRFSKFVHGVANLFEDCVNSFPFWLSQVETDIRRDPHQAFEEEQERAAKAAEDEFAVGSLLGRSPNAFRAGISSPVGSPVATTSSIRVGTPGKATADMTRRAASKMSGTEDVMEEEEDSDDDGLQGHGREDNTTAISHAGLGSLFPSFSTSKYARRHRERRVKLPPGVQEPAKWLKDQGPVQVEAKVWLANQRTFIKWQHVSILLATLSLGLYNAAGEHNNIARTLGVAYTLIAVFAACWGWGMYIWRSRLIEQRSGKDFDNVVGPVVICIGLVVALCLNFGFKYNAVMRERSGGLAANQTYELYGAGDAEL